VRGGTVDACGAGKIGVPAGTDGTAARGADGLSCFVELVFLARVSSGVLLVSDAKEVLMDLSIIIPAYNAEATLRECLGALESQVLPRGRSLEVIVLDDGSKDGTAEACQGFPVMLIRQKNAGAGAARNAGIKRARGTWIAFTDADCIASRRWAHWLLEAAEGMGPLALGAAGKTVGHESRTPAARFVDLAGGLDAQIHLGHRVFPFAPTCNVLYRRAALLAVGGFDERFGSYEAADLHHRLMQAHGGRMAYEPRALVLHRHRACWGGYWRQQRSYGGGYAQLFIRYPEELSWGLARELGAWGRLARLAPGAVAGWGDRGLVRQGKFIKRLAQRLGFVGTYFSRRERLRFCGRAPELEGAVA
jgi:glycosyltransferase involved in cell wall biosynthesis